MKHLIGKQIIDFKMQRSGDSFEVSNQLSRLYWERVVPLLEDLFDQYTGEGELLRIDRLEIDLGRLTEEQLRQGRFLDLLKRLLEKELTKLATQGGTKVEKVPIVYGQFEQWLFFLEKGYLPWNNTGPTRDWTKELLDTMATEMSAVGGLRALLERSRVASERLVLQYPPYFLKTIIELYSGKKQNKLILAVKELQSLATTKPALQPTVRSTYWSRRTLELFFWQKLIEDAIGPGSKLDPEILIGRFLKTYYQPVFLARLLEYRDLHLPIIQQALRSLVEHDKDLLSIIRSGKVDGDQPGSSTQELPKKERELADSKEQADSSSQEAVGTKLDQSHQSEIATNPEQPNQASEQLEKSFYEAKLQPDTSAEEELNDLADLQETKASQVKEQSDRLKEDAPTGQPVDRAADDFVPDEKEALRDKTIDSGLSPENTKNKEGEDLAKEKRREIPKDKQETRIDGKQTEEKVSPEQQLSEMEQEKQEWIPKKDQLASKEETGVESHKGAEREEQLPNQPNLPVTDQRIVPKESLDFHDKEGENQISGIRSPGPSEGKGIVERSKQEMAFTRKDVFPDEKVKQEIPSYLSGEKAPPYFEVPIDEPIYINNAGIILVHPFLKRYFETLGLLEQSRFRNEKAKHRAVRLLHYLATGLSKTPEYDLVLPRVLCGLPLNMPLDHTLRLTKKQKSEGDAMLEALIEHWGALGGTSPDGLREGFLERKGKLVFSGGNWNLHIENQTLDILLDRLPWGIHIIKLPWMMDMLKVEWR